ncbi:MAG: tRNA pseudouridine(55) synthase TruB [Planctomycetaceae bacterium]
MFGVLNLQKPPEVTSRDVVNVIQRMVKPVKVGHAGTLDPMATGVLLVCLGPATRLIPLLQKAPKTYVAEFRLGETSNTDDATGQIQTPETAPLPVDRQRLEQTLRQFEGEIRQVPPAFSAVKIQGQRAYAKARRGEDVQLTAKTVTVKSIEIPAYDWPVLNLKIVCGSGTYIRSIARDLGQQLGCGALMSALQRTAIGRFESTSAIDASTLTRESLDEHIVNPMKVVGDLNQYRCTPDDEWLVNAGRQVDICPDRLRCVDSQSGDPVAMISDDDRRLLALGEFAGANRLQPRTVFRT